MNQSTDTEVEVEVFSRGGAPCPTGVVIWRVCDTVRSH
jgi:hypothetical protein